MTFHRNLAFSLAALLAAGLLWGVVAAARGGRAPALADYLRLLEGVLLVQVAIGLVLWARGGHPSALHVMYGIVLLAPLPLGIRAWRLRRDRGGRWLLAAACLADLLFLVRAIGTG